MLVFERSKWWLLVFAALLIPTPSHASIVQALELDEMVAQADQILVGKVVFKESLLREDGKIVTRTRFRVTDPVKGRMNTADEIMIEALGGVVGTIGMRVEGSPTFAVGDEVFLFARAGKREVYHPVGMAQGAMPIVLRGTERMVMPNRAGMMLVRRDASGRLVKRDGAVTAAQKLDAFKKSVRDIVKAQKAKQ